MSGPLGYTEAGRGEALVLVHGYLGSARHWLGQIEAFSVNRRVIAVDLAGFGDSAHLEAPGTIGGHAALVLETLRQLGFERFDLAGHSMGGMIVQEMAASAPACIRRLILYGTGAIGVMPDRFEPIEVSRRRLAREGLEATVRRIAASWFAAGTAAPGFGLCLAEGLRASPRAAMASFAAWEAWDGRPALPRLEMPTLVLWGDGDRSYRWEQTELLWRTIPDARLAVVPGCAHAVHLEKPGIFNLLVEDFLSGG